MTDFKALSRERFGAFAKTYVDSATHASGPDLERLLALADPQPGWRALDIATGGGHTALRIAPRVRSLIAADLALPMLEAARAHAAAQGIAGIDYVAADAEALPFPDAAFDLITCRIAPHHFPNAFAFMRECARTLKPGGRLVIQDHVNPDERAAA
ncbi:MAG: methyltransferase domain-containing protein, partial [Anaerolinea sp.]|nr:methyltransferase domain-containing protein [Anaerolinea sp.]